MAEVVLDKLDSVVGAVDEPIWNVPVVAETLDEVNLLRVQVVALLLVVE